METKGAACVIVLTVASLFVESVHPHHWPPYPHLLESGHPVHVGGPGTAAVSSNGTVDPLAVYTVVASR